MATIAEPASSADFDFVDLVESHLKAESVSLGFFARMKLRNMYGRSVRLLERGDGWLDLAKAQGSAGRLAAALTGLKKRKINRADVGTVLGFLCPGLYPIC
jgi:hypothetical protein